jgi:hypothetical protein
VIVRVDGNEGMSMYPRLLPGATLLVDRHYNSLKPYRKGESNMYAVRKNDECTIKYVELAGNYLVLRPHNHAYPVEVMPMANERPPPTTLSGGCATWGSRRRNAFRAPDSDLNYAGQRAMASPPQPRHPHHHARPTYTLKVRSTPLRPGFQTSR